MVTVKDAVTIEANLFVEVRDLVTGETRQIAVPNLTLTTGRNLIRDWAYGDAPAGLTHFAVGTDGTARTQADTGLGTEVFRDAITQAVKGSGTLTIKYYLASGSANGNTLREAGLVNAASAGTFYAAAVTGAIEKTLSIEVTYTWILTWTASTS